MRKLIIIIFLIPFILRSQTIKFLYTEGKVYQGQNFDNLTETEKATYQEKYFALIYSNGKSIYYPVSNLKDTTIVTNRIIDGKEIPKEKLILKGVTGINVYKDFTVDLFRMEITFLGKHYSIKDRVLQPEWKITNTNKKILGYKCRKSTASINGNVVTAWFTDELPPNIGPQIYGGLPGTILLMNYNGIKVYKAKKTTFLKDEVDISEPKAKAGIINFKEYRKQVYGE